MQSTTHRWYKPDMQIDTIQKYPPLKIGDWVLLRRKKADKTKFAPIADGPFQILEIGTNNVKLKFPRNSTAHPVINISRVQLYFGPRPEIFTEPQE